jgi:hypothetical protein
MDFGEAFLLFFSGAIAHSFLIRMLGIHTKTMLYRLVLINCLSLLKYVSKHAEQHLLLVVEQEEKSVEIVMKYWQDMAIASLRNSTPHEIWATMSVTDWEQAMRLLSKLEHTGDDNEV